MACELVMSKAREKGVEIIPIDSEHSAIMQCLEGEKRESVRNIILTCSGGSLRDVPAERFADITPEEALRHPQWSMGANITIDSATLVNKGFEVIEARWLFDVNPDQIKVVIHPQSIVHSMVEFEDGAIKAQLGTPDMHMPISYALMFPKRAVRGEHFSFMENPTLTFAEVDRVKYPALDIAYNCLRAGGTAACTMNGANEVAVAAFLDGEIGFTDIYTTVINTFGQLTAHKTTTSLDGIIAADREARAIAKAEINKIRGI